MIRGVKGGNTTLTGADFENKDVNCHYVFDTIPLKWFGFPE